MPPRPILYVLAILVVASWIPLALIARARTQTSEKPRIHIIQDMDDQPRFKAQRMNPMFADRRAMRPPVEGAIARGELREDTAFFTGRAAGDNAGWVSEFPVEVTAELMRRGRDRFAIFCAPCHGASGNGEGMIHARAEALAEGTWVPQSNLLAETTRARPVGYIYNAIANGVRNMPAYGRQIPPEDRWAITAYVRALQRSQNARLEDVPEEERRQLQNLMEP